MKWSAPSSSRPPPPKHPLFTTKIFSTKSFGPGHLVGAGILVLGVVGITKLVGARTRANATRGAVQPPTPVRRSEDEPKLARAANDRGQYGGK